MAILPKLVGLCYKEISLHGKAPDSVTAFWPAAHYLIKETLPETLACVTRWIIALIGTNGYLLIWCEKVRKKNIVEIGGKRRWKMSETGSETNYRSAAFKSMRRKIYAQSSTRPLSLKKISYLLRRFTILSFAKDGVRVICGCYRSLVPRFCVLFSLELLCLAVMNFDDQVDCWKTRREARLLKSRRNANTKRWTMVNFYRWINLEATATNVDAWSFDV